MTVKLLCDWQDSRNGRNYKVGNLVTTDAGTESGLVEAKIADINLTGGTSYIDPPITPKIMPVFAEVDPVSGIPFVIGKFVKTDKLSPVLLKTAANTLSIKAGTVVFVLGRYVGFPSNTAVTMPTLNAGSDYSVWVSPAGAAVAVEDNYTAQATAPVAGSVKIGGFHYGLVAAGTAVAGGSFATTGNGMIWTQADVDKIAGINEWSLWDLAYRPLCPNPRGMVRTVTGTWVDIYLCNTDVDANGTSRYNLPIASGTVLPKIPAAFGGNGTTAYTGFTWFNATEIAGSVGKRLLWELEFSHAAYGVTESQALGGALETPPASLRQAGYTSKYGVEQATGHVQTWGLDSGQVGETYSWQSVTGGRGQSYTTGHKRVLLGGARDIGSNAGSRCSRWDSSPLGNGWYIGLRAACDHLQGM